MYEEYRERLSPDLFPDYEWLYWMIEDAHQEGLTYKGVVSRCDIHQMRTVKELRQAYISTTRMDICLKQAKQNKLANDLIQLSQRIQSHTNSETADDMLRELQNRSFQLFTTDTEDVIDTNKEVDKFAEWFKEIMDDPGKAYGLQTGLEDMDCITTGWHKHDLIVVGAWTSMGKTAFMLENILRLNNAGYKCAVFSLEMTKRQMYLRMMANLMGVSLKVLKTGQLAKERYPEFQEKKEILRNIYVDDSRGVDAEYITDMMRRLKRTQGLDFVAVDYIQDVKEVGEHNDNSGSAIARICRKLRAAAHECDVPVMGLSQVKRESQNRQDKRPMNSDLAGSTGIETSADVIALLYRDEYYNPDTNKKNILEVNFTKQRNGELGRVELFYDKQNQRITSLERKYPGIR